jgi:hypothetical protein
LGKAVSPTVVIPIAPLFNIWPKIPKIPKVLRTSPAKGEFGYPMAADSPMNPQVREIRTGTLANGTQSFIEVVFVQGPL